MKKQLAYDLPTRMFHWLFVAGFIAAFCIAKFLDDDSSLYPYHMMIGLFMAFMVFLRIIWGFLGTRYARFVSFELNPLELFDYFKNLFRSTTKKYFGHNPASSWAAIIMMLCSFGLAFTGLQMASNQNKEFFEEIHEILAYIFLVTALLHIAGIILHTIRHQEAIGLSMIDGHKAGSANEPPIEKNAIPSAILFLFLILFFASYLLKNYDTQSKTLNFFGTSLQLGENEDED